MKLEERLKEKGRTLFGILKKILDKAAEQKGGGDRRAIDDWGLQICEEGEKQISIEDPEETLHHIMEDYSSTMYIITEDGTVNGCREYEGKILENSECGQPELEPIQITEELLDSLIKSFSADLEGDTFT